MSKLKDNRVALSFLGVLVGAVLALTGVVLGNLNGIHSAVRWGVHSYDVLDQGGRVTNALGAEEASAVAYGRALDAQGLRSYRAASARTDSELAQLKTLTADNGLQQERIRRLEQVLRDRSVRAGQRDYVTAARVQIAQLELTERNLLRKRAKAAERAFLTAHWALFFAAGTGILVVGAFGWRAATILIKARRAAQAASLAKSQFLANISHEIRTPLNGVLGMAQAMAQDELSTAQRERLALLQDSGTHLTALLGNMLDFTKIEAGELQIDEKDFDLVVLIANLMLTFRPEADEKGLRLDTIISADMPALWRGDPHRVRQILCNLLANAIKFTDAGEVRVQAESTADGQLRLRVIDTGRGIAPGNIDGIFEMFRQVDNSSTRSDGGAGLGLTISRDLARRMGGDLTVQSVPGHGSTFEVNLALTAVEVREEPQQAAFAEVRDQPGPRVLVAEDNPTNQRVMRALLSALSVDPLIVENGRLAVDAWRQGRFDVILMDLQMPELDGLLATREIREIERVNGWRRTPIVAVSANAMAHHVQECLAAGMNGHVSKPVGLAELVDALDAAMAPEAAGEGDVQTNVA